MKRVKAACILQTLVFSQKPEMGYSKEKAIQINHEEIEHYKKMLERAKTRYIIRVDHADIAGHIDSADHQQDNAYDLKYVPFHPFHLSLQRRSF